jgi:outer membrane immunogenic protein
LNGGGHWGTDSVSTSVAANTFLSPNNVAIINNALPFNKDVTGLVGGGQAGFNWHVWSFVLGVEADISALSGTATRSAVVPLTVPTQQATSTDTVSDRWTATFRGRLGYAADYMLFYVTSGGAAANRSIAHVYSDNIGAAPTTDAISQTRYGWTVGGGIEYALASNWSIRAEYLFATFSGITSTLSFQNTPAKGATLAYTDAFSESLARAAINYKIGR